MSIYFGDINSTPQQIRYLQGFQGLENTINLLGLINPTSAVLSVANEVNTNTFINSNRTGIRSDFGEPYSHSNYINLMKYSFYSIEPEIIAFGIILCNPFQWTGTIAPSGGEAKDYIIPTDFTYWSDINTSNFYIRSLSNINQSVQLYSNKVLNSTTSSTGLNINCLPCFILSNKQKIVWPIHTYEWNCLLQYFNFQGTIQKTYVFGGSANVRNAVYMHEGLFNAEDEQGYISSKTIYDTFEKNLYKAVGSHYFGITYGNCTLTIPKTETNSAKRIKISNDQSILPVIFINEISGQSGDLSFKIDKVYKFWYQPGMTWIDFTSDTNTKKYNFSSHIKISSNNVTYNDASLRGTTATSYTLYIKNSDGTFTPVNKNDLIDGSLNYTTYSS